MTARFVLRIQKIPAINRRSPYTTSGAAREGVKSEVDREWTLQQDQLDPDDNTESKRPSFRPAVVPYQTLMSLCNELHRPDEGSSRFGKRFFQGKRH